MKNLFLMIAVTAIFSLNVCGQAGKDVPAKVSVAFSQKFPNTTKVKWGKENDKAWEAEFKMDGKEYSANFDANGTWMETEYEISEKEIPALLKATLEKEFAGYAIKEAEISETAQGIAYEFELKRSKSTIEVSLDKSGKVLKKEVSKEEKEE